MNNTKSIVRQTANIISSTNQAGGARNEILVSLVIGVKICPRFPLYNKFKVQFFCFDILERKAFGAVTRMKPTPP